MQAPHVLLFNLLGAAAASRVDRMKNVELRHVQCEPRDREALAAAVNIATFESAIILHGGC